MSVQVKQVYKCEHCGIIVEGLHGGGGDLVCCGEKMKLFVENTVDASKEKHVPVIEKTAKGYLVKIGSVPHPMEEKHYIEFIELIIGENIYRKFLKPGDKPEAEFEVSSSGTVMAREYCNLHGLWAAQL